jgi:hypothetical protein
MSNTEPITFTLGEETQPKIEASADFGISLFNEQYTKSFEWIVSHLNKVGKVQNEPDKVQKEYKLMDLNNILAYIGERGSGKTSCMLSVARMLGEHDPEHGKSETTIAGLSGCGKSFYVLDHVDPSFFDKKNNIVSIITARLYNRFKKRVEERDRDDKHDCKNQLLECFQEVNDNIERLLGKNRKEAEDSLQRIDNLAAAVNLRKNIGKLVKEFLRYFDKDVLVVPIDDVDLHTSEAYAMAEQMRKYFAHHKIIILFAAKLDQLSLVVKKQYVNEFGELFKLQPKAQENILDIGMIEEMVDRYLGKLIPLGQRIYLADTEKLFDQELQIIDPRRDVKDNKGGLEFTSVREAVPTLIFRKTRYLFYNAKGMTSPIVPRNLRELRHLIYMLCQMEDYWTEGKNQRPEYNKALFKKYFFETWTASNLEERDQRIVQDLLHTTDAAVFNKAVIMVLKGRFDMNGIYQHDDRFDDLLLYTSYGYIVRDSNINFNTSLGDVMTIIKYIEQTTYRRADAKLLFMIRSLYSIKLYEYYDEYTNNYCDNPEVANILAEGGEAKDHEIQRLGILSDVTNYEKLVGGNFVNSSHDVINIIPQEKGGDNRTQRSIHIGSINDETALIKMFPELSAADRVVLREFFALTTSRRAYSRNDTTNDRYRMSAQSGKPYYRQTLADAKSAIFDVVCLFFNLLNIKECYGRFDTKDVSLYKDALKEPKSILNALIEATRKREGNPDLSGADLGRRMLSWFSIRNSEILDDLTDYLNRVEYKLGGNQEILVAFFKNIAQNYERETYPKVKGGLHYSIEYSFTSIIADALKTITPEVFDNFYRIADAEFDVALIVKGLNINTPTKSKSIINRMKKHFPIIYSLHEAKIKELFTEDSYSRNEIEAKSLELKWFIDNSAH